MCKPVQAGRKNNPRPQMQRAHSFLCDICFSTPQLQATWACYKILLLATLALFPHRLLTSQKTKVPFQELLTLVLVQSTAMESTLPACPLQQWRAFTLFFSTFHSHSRTVWSIEALSNRHDKLSEGKKNQACLHQTQLSKVFLVYM